MFLFSPSAHFKYILDIYILGALLPALWIAEREPKTFFVRAVTPR